MGGAVGRYCTARLQAWGEGRFQFNEVPVICATHCARYLILTTVLLGTYPQFYT